MKPLLKNILQLAAVGLIVGFLGYFADGPSHQYFAPGQAQIKLSFMHVGARVEECRRRSQEELAELPRHLRRPLDCVRERVPVVVDITLNGESLYYRALPATGLRHDGPARGHATFRVPAGEYRIAVRIRDSRRQEGYDHERQETIVLTGGQNLIIDYVREQGGIIFR
jgi:hypothetical protein